MRAPQAGHPISRELDREGTAPAEETAPADESALGSSRSLASRMVFSLRLAILIRVLLVDGPGLVFLPVFPAPRARSCFETAREAAGLGMSGPSTGTGTHSRTYACRLPAGSRSWDTRSASLEIAPDYTHPQHISARTCLGLSSRPGLP